ncbi:MAG: hypothetical protein K5841_06340, partial [Fretibacterium sp.]|nr:hypothetical protein [Fretibacterium sp.]
LARVGINQEDERAKDRPRLSDYLKGLPDDVKLAAPQWILDLDVTKRQLSAANMTLEEFFDVRDLVKQIEHVGRMERNLIAQQETQDFAKTVEKLAESITAIYGQPEGRGVDPNDKGAGVLKQGLATLERTETIIRRADGMKEQGPWWETFLRPVHRANDREIQMQTEAAIKFAEILKKHFPDKKAARAFLTQKMDTGMIDPKTGQKLYWTGENLLGAMLNWGNQHNRERLVYGNGFVENALGQKVVNPADDAQYYAFYQVGAGAAEALFAKYGNDNLWEFCQDVWDMIDTYWPEIRALQEKMTGVAPDKVEASPVKTASGKVLRGGYYPVKFDANQDWSAGVWKEKEDARALYEDQFHRAGTRHGHTKERVDRVAGRMVSLKLGVIPEHLGNVIHDLAYRPVVRDLNKLVNDDRVRGLLIHAVGKEAFKQLNPWIQALAAPEGVTDGGERAVGMLIGHVMTSALGFNIPTRFMQLANFARAGYKLGYGNIIRAVVNALDGRILWDEEFREGAFKLSPELEDRLRANRRDLGQILGVYLDGKWDRTMSNVQAAAMFGLNWADAIVGVPIWHVAYDQGMKKFNDQRKAIDYADQMTRLTNNTTQRKDAAAVLRGGHFKKLFTMFYNAANTSYNLFLEEYTRAKLGSTVDRVKFIGFLFAVFTVEAMIQSAVKRRAPWNDDDWDKEDKGKQIAKWMAQGTLADFSAMFPLVRDMVGATYAAGGRGASAYRMTPAADLGETVVKGVNSILKFGADTWDGKETRGEAAAKAAADLVGVGLGLPTPGLYKFYRTWRRWMDGNPNYSPLGRIWGPRGR